MIPFIAMPRSRWMYCSVSFVVPTLSYPNLVFRYQSQEMLSFSCESKDEKKR